MERSSEDKVVIGKLEAADGSFASSDGYHIFYGLGGGESAGEEAEAEDRGSKVKGQSVRDALRSG